MIMMLKLFNVFIPFIIFQESYQAFVFLLGVGLVMDRVIGQGMIIAELE